MRKNKNNQQTKVSFIERVGSKIPDPVIIFICLYIFVMVITGIFGGTTFETIGNDGSNVVYEIKNMFQRENVLWIFNNALLTNWLAYAGGILGTILIVMFGIGIAEESGLLATLIRKIGGNIPERLLPYLLVFLGIMSNIATDAGYIILIPLAGLLYLGLKKNPLIGMFAAFAGVSAGFSANLVPATVVDVIVGKNAQSFAETQGVPFVSYLGKTINPFMMHYIFMIASTLLLVVLGGFITNRVIRPKFEKVEYTIPDDFQLGEYQVSKEEKRALRFAGLGFILSAALCVALAFGPLSSYYDEAGTKVMPYLDNIILLITFVFFTSGLFYGIAIGKFKSASDVVTAMSKQVGGMGYTIILTFFSYNFLALLTYSNLGTYITYLGANLLEALNLANSPTLLIIGFIVITAIINLFVGGLTSKWMLLGPIFIPMLYQANTSMTPDVVAAAYRLADSSTNIITPLMSYAGIILIYMRKYKKDFTVGNLVSAMFPYSITFLISWTLLLLAFIGFKIPLGF
ncbi:AbgT family transporter [Anaerosporobacter faecicola]|uniref:AbgT family transporter n=1 Tax=Anaerosporobacter faecicola TaxID=2718714 RepID=UPI00143B2C17|nr:AbgT family transporter [Anaerosporobacter faecicola]